MAGVQAVLVDVYDTALTCDFGAHDEELLALVGVSAEVWRRESQRLSPVVMDGRLSLAEAFGEVMATAGMDPRPDLLRELVRHDQRLLFAGALVYEDTVPFLRDMRNRGIRTAFVSNCAGNTRPLLEQLGLVALVDSVVLSCEAGVSKPAAALYLRALDDLGVSPDVALFVDDQERYYAGAAAVGMHAVRIYRHSNAARDGVRRLTELCDLL